MGSYLGIICSFCTKQGFAGSNLPRPVQCTCKCPSPAGCTENFDAPLPYGANSPVSTLPHANDAISTGSASTQTTKGTKTNSSGSTNIDASGMYGNYSAWGFNTVGGRQNLNLKRGVLDLRWICQKGYDSDTAGKLPNFYSAGKYASFGYLNWIWDIAQNGGPMPYASDGYVRRQPIQSAYGTLNFDARSADWMLANGNAYYTYDVYRGTYFYYTPGDSKSVAAGGDGQRYVQKRMTRDNYLSYYYYDSLERLISIKPLAGRAEIYFKYDPGPMIAAMNIRDLATSEERSTYYYYDANNALSCLLEPDLIATYFELSNAANGVLIKEVDPDGYTTYFDYINTNATYKMQQESRVTYFWEYYTGSGGSGSFIWNGNTPVGLLSFMFRTNMLHGAEVTAEVSGQSPKSYLYSSSNIQTRYRLLGETSPNGYQALYGTDTLNPGNMRYLYQNEDNGTTNYGYAPNSLDLITETGPRHSASFYQATYYEYNALGNRTKIFDPLKNTTYFEYDSTGSLVRTLDARNGATYYYYDQFGQNNVVLDALKNPAYYAYNLNNFTIRSLDARGFTTYYTYDKMDQMLSMSLPTGELSNYAYSQRGLKVREDSPLNKSAYYAYDAYQNRTKAARTYKSGYSTTYYEYDVRNAVSATIDPNGNKSDFFSDILSRRLRTKDPLGNTTYFTYDPARNLRSTTDPKGNLIWSEYGARDLLARRVRGMKGIPPPRPADIKGHWTLNEASGTRADNSGNNNNLTDNNSTGSTPGYIGNAARFVPASSQYLSITNAAQTGLNPTSTVTIAMWARLNSQTPNKFFTLFSKWDEPGQGSYFLAIQTPINGAGQPLDPVLYWGSSYFSGGQDFYTTVRLPYGSFTGLDLATWHHYAVVYSQVGSSYTLVNLYIDGLNVSPLVTGSIPIFGTTADVRIGARKVGGVLTDFFDGDIDEVYFYNVALTDAEVALLANQRLEAEVNVASPNATATYYGYDLDANLKTVLNDRKFSTYYDYDALSRKINSFDALGNTTYFGYDPNGNLTALLNPRNITTYFSYDLLQRQTAMVNGLNQVSYYGYDSVGNRTRSMTPGNHTTYFDYDGSNRLSKTQDALLNATYYHYDAAGRMDRVLDARSNTTYYNFDQLDRSTSVYNALSQSVYFDYDLAGNLLAVKNHILGTAMAVTYFGYDAANRKTRTYDALTGLTYFGYDAASNLVRVQDARSNTTYYDYDMFNNVSALLDRAAGVVYYQYDANNNRTVVRDPRANSTYYGYDGLDRLSQVQDALTKTTYYGFDANSNRIKLLNVRNFATYFGYDALDRLTQIQDPMNGVTYFGYDLGGNRCAVLPPVGSVAYFGYDLIDNLAQTLDGFGNSTYFGYDANSNRIKVQDARRFTTYYNYDVLNRLSRVQDPLNGVTYFGFDVAGNRSYLFPPRGLTTYFGYDTLNRLVKTLNPVINATYFGYDANSNRIKTLSPRLFATYFGYDKLDRLTQVQDAGLGVAYFGFDANSNTIKTLDALNRATYFGYDALNRLVAMRDAVGNSAYYQYDAIGNRTAETDSLIHTTYYGYDGLNRLGVMLDPLSRAAYYGYDAGSNLVKTWDRNRTAVYFGYDKLNRRSIIQYPAEIQYFGYDANSNMSAMKDAWGATYFGYDALNRLSQRQTPRLDTVYYGYDAASNLIKLQYPVDSATCYYGYDNAQRLSQQVSPAGFVTYYTYDASSNVSKKALGNGVNSWATFDGVERMTSLRYEKAGVALTYFDYNRDVSGRINIIQRENNLAIYYTYDNIDRLLSESWRKASDSTQVYAFTYSYDGANNRLQMRREAAVGVETESAYYSYAVDNSLTKRRVQVPPSTFTDTYFYYDNNGALTTKLEGAAATYFAYGPQQLCTIIAPPTEAATYFYYDGQLSRYGINQAGIFTYFLWDGLNPIEERKVDGSMKARYTNGYTRLPGIGSIAEVQRVAGPLNSTYYQYPLMDHRGTSYAITDGSGNILTSYTIDSFGRQLASPGGSDPNVPNDLVYQTNWRTVTIGGKNLCLSPSRLYDPETGIFLGTDLIIQASKLYSSSYGNTLGIFYRTKFVSSIYKSVKYGNYSIKPYVYVGNNPVNWSDENGLWFAQTFLSLSLLLNNAAPVVSAAATSQAVVQTVEAVESVEVATGAVETVEAAATGLEATETALAAGEATTTVASAEAGLAVVAEVALPAAAVAGTAYISYSAGEYISTSTEGFWGPLVDWGIRQALEDPDYVPPGNPDRRDPRKRRKKEKKGDAGDCKCSVEPKGNGSPPIPWDWPNPIDSAGKCLVACHQTPNACGDFKYYRWKGAAWMPIA